MLKVATVCTGIGSPEMAIKNLGIEHEIVFGCEIDKYAKETYLANFEPGFMVPDMTKCDWEDEKYYSDLFIGGIPCQAFSLAGKRLGELDPRGLLFFDFYRYVKNQKPKYFIIENVKGLLSDNDGNTFQNWINLLGQSVNSDAFMFPHEDSLMYNLHWQVLNTKDYGLPQNRERVFLIGIRNDLPNTFVFPKKIHLELRLKDILEDEVDEKYYLSDKMVKTLARHENKIIENTNPEVSATIHAGYFKCGGRDQQYLKVSSATASGYEIATEGDSINLEHPNSETRRGRAGKQVAQTLTTSCNQGVMIGAMRGRNPENPSDRTTGAPTQQMLEINENGTSNCLTSVQKDNLVIEKFQEFEIADYRADEGLRIRTDGISPCLNSSIRDAEWTPQAGTRNPPITSNGYRIRKLTPLECFRLQGFPDSYIKPVSNSQLYKQSGNSISVPVIQAILKNLLTDYQHFKKFCS